MITVSQALERIAERTVESREYLKRTLTQRRNTPTNIYGIPFYNELTVGKRFQCHISILANLEYFTRFQFKLYIANAQGTINPNLFKFEIGDPDVYNSETGVEEENLVDISSYLEEQENEWVDGDGWFPSVSFGEGDEGGDYYDILDACSVLYAEGRVDDVNAILSPGNKLVQITSPVPCDVTFIPYLDYTTVNR